MGVGSVGVVVDSVGVVVGSVGVGSLGDLHDHAGYVAQNSIYKCCAPVTRTFSRKLEDFLRSALHIKLS